MGTQQQKIVGLGGQDWPPLFAHFYLTAARTLIAASAEKALPEVALPVLYTQRHCLELVVKDLILGCFHLDEAQTVAGKQPAGVQPPRHTHDLLRLLEGLCKDLARLNFHVSDELSAIDSLAKQFADLEDESPERFRYAYVEEFKNGKAPPTGFPEARSVDLGKLQRELEQVFSTCADVESGASLWRRLYDKAGCLVAGALNEGLISLDQEKAKGP